MARSINKLSARAVVAAAKPGLLSDGGGLYLQIGPSGSKSWLFRFMRGGRAREMGLGALNAVGLSLAREKAAKCRTLLDEDVDPIEARNAERLRQRREAVAAMTFKQCAEGYIAANRTAWTNAKHSAQWSNTLSTYAYPFFGDLAVSDVDAGLVLQALEPIWSTKPETASRLRGRIEAVLDWATVRKQRAGDNPARWKGHLSHSLPASSKVRRVKHHAALPFDEIGAFLEKLREQEGVSARALEFAILTAGRTSEVTGAKWSEIDLDAKVWTIPQERMKASREHRVPLSNRALEVLSPLQGLSSFVFPGGKAHAGLSNNALLATLHRMNRKGLTAHGFRSTFRDWCAEQTNYPREVAEMALAHAVGDKVEAAYRRGDLFEKRKHLMDAWAKYCGQVRAEEKVVTIGGEL